jgi:5-methylcytosine-specific restriction endonuclease McrA
MPADPKPIRVKLSPAGKAKLKESLYFGRANRHCETCGCWCSWRQYWLTDADMHHKKSQGSGGGDTEENCIIVCRKCHSKIHNGELICK